MKGEVGSSAVGTLRGLVLGLSFGIRNLKAKWRHASGLWVPSHSSSFLTVKLFCPNLNFLPPSCTMTTIPSVPKYKSIFDFFEES